MLFEDSKLKNGRYIVKQMIKSSRHGNVYYVQEHPYIGRMLVLKELCPQIRKDGKNTVQIGKDILGYSEYLEAFKYERYSSIKVSSLFPEMKKYYIDSFEENNIQYLVLHNIVGKTLEEYRADILGKKVYFEDIIISLLWFVIKLHKNEIIHGDISPDNIIILKDSSKAVLIDYGNTIISQNTHFSFKRGFSAPELKDLNVNIIEKNADIYSIGSIIYFILTGNIIDDEKFPISILDLNNHFYHWVVLKCLQKNPKKRFQSCSSICCLMYIYKFRKIFLIILILILFLFNILYLSNKMIVRGNVEWENTYLFNESLNSDMKTSFRYNFDDEGIHIIGFDSSSTDIVIPEEIEGRNVNSVDEINLNITNIVISEGVKTIGDYAFQNCQYLKSIQIPKSVDYIGENAFMNCGQLEKIEIDPDNAFYVIEGNKLIRKDDGTVIFELMYQPKDDVLKL